MEAARARREVDLSLYPQFVHGSSQASEGQTYSGQTRTPAAAVTGGQPTRSIGGHLDPPLRERIRLRDSTWGGEAPGVRARTARTGALFCLLGALFGLISAVTPDAAVHDEDLLVIVSVLAAALALALVATGDRMPVAGFHLVALLGTALASAAVYAWGTGHAYPPLPFLWVTIFVFYFFRLRPAMVHMVLIAAGYAIVLSLEDTGRTQVDGWLAAVGTLAIGGFVVALLRDRLVGTIERLAQFANRDPLTELLNRRGFEDALRHRARARPAQQRAAQPRGGRPGRPRAREPRRWGTRPATRRCAPWRPRSGPSSGASTALRGWEARSSP